MKKELLLILLLSLAQSASAAEGFEPGDDRELKKALPSLDLAFDFDHLLNDLENDDKKEIDRNRVDADQLAVQPLVVQQLMPAAVGSIQYLINEGIVDFYPNRAILNFLKLNITSLKGLDTILNISRVRFLQLSFNKLKSIETGVFINLKALVLLDISYNKLINFDIQVFDHLTALKYLYLQNNKLREDCVEKIIKYCQKHKIYLEIENQDPDKAGYFTKPALRELRQDSNSHAIHDEVEDDETAKENN